MVKFKIMILPSSQVIGHDWAVELFDRQYQADRIPHALLISGTPNIGKATLARYFAQYLNCQAEQKPCGECRSCRKMISGSHPDVRILDHDSERLKIEQIRELQRELTLSPYEGRYRVTVLCNFERATTSAANALLKTLEEPASQVVLILTTVDPGALLPTIVSRCQGVVLRSVPTSLIAEALENQWQVSSEQAGLLAQLSAGRLGWAIRSVENENLLVHRETSLQDMLDLLEMHRPERLAYAQGLSRDQATLKETLHIWLTIWRDLLLLKSGTQTKIINLDWESQLQNVAAQSTLEQAKEMVDYLRKAILNIDYNVNPRLNLEVLLLRLPKFKLGRT